MDAVPTLKTTFSYRDENFLFPLDKTNKLHSHPNYQVKLGLCVTNGIVNSSFLRTRGVRFFFFLSLQFLSGLPVMHCNPLILILTIKLILSLYYLVEKISWLGEIFVFISLTVIITHLSTGIKPQHPSHWHLVYRIYGGRVVSISSTVSETHLEYAKFRQINDNKL